MSTTLGDFLESHKRSNSKTSPFLYKPGSHWHDSDDHGDSRDGEAAAMVSRLATVMGMVSLIHLPFGY